MGPGFGAGAVTAGRVRGTVAAACLLMVLALGLTATPARAARVHPLLLSETLPEEETPYAVAVDQATHHFYVGSVREVAPITYHVLNFEENGQIDSGWELTSPPTLLKPQRVAVDNSAGATSGYLYATYVFESAVQQFDAAGEATAVRVDAASVPAAGTAQGGGLPPVVNGGEFKPVAVAVDGSGDVFVVERETEAIDEFTSAGTFVRQLAAGEVTGGTNGIALDSSDHLYLANEGASGLGKGLFELSATTGECIPEK